MNDPFENAVFRPLHRQKTAAKAAGRLMVGAVYTQSSSIEVAEERRGDMGVMTAVRAVDLTVARDVLDQRAAKVDIDYLQSPADAKDRLSSGEKFVQQ